MNHYTCKHFTGTLNPACAAGVAYDSVTVDPKSPGSAYRKPCINWVEREKSLPANRQRPLNSMEKAESVGKCDKHELPTAEEIAKWESDFAAETNRSADRTMVARDAIQMDLYRRYHDHDKAVTLVDKDRAHRWHHPQKNYFCGSGVMPCPVCNVGKLNYSRSAYNGHVHARCSTDGCVAWME